MTSAVILAGGLGTRLRSAVPDLPKPMAPISGRPFLEHQLDYWIKQGVNHFVLSVGYRYEVIVDHFGNRYKDAELDYVIEETPLGTGGGLLLAAEKVSKDESFLLLNGDTYFAVDLKTLIEFSLANDADWCFSLFRTHEEGRYMGMDVSPQGQIVSLKSGTGRPGQLANGGVYWVNPRALLNERFSPGDKCSLEDDIFMTAMVSGQRLLGVEFSGAFIDIGVPDDYHRAPELLSS
ncbi:sugar phosphate nucleotidyltransferase [Methylobacter sp. Wu8]|uniref:sugar phosphate nucleotidyltransferase n=1 Tax=Methylobacter sp. Wu8 TaxID=3118457 RepID=UPI002F2D1162|nr:sugar phosphate nucleotidyltransferase [Methylobacter tundripaludum]